MIFGSFSYCSTEGQLFPTASRITSLSLNTRLRPQGAKPTPWGVGFPRMRYINIGIHPTEVKHEARLYSRMAFEI
jgi:hypothetical protein